MINKQRSKLQPIKQTHRTANTRSRVNSENNFTHFASNCTNRKLTILTEVNDYRDWSFLTKRRESQLNSLFNDRKNKLNQIMKINMQIHEKINSQETHYPSKIWLGSGNEAKQSRARFHTQEDTQNRRILGPIHDFIPLKKSAFDGATAQQFPISKKKSAFSKLEKKKGKNKEEDLFTIY